jgi:hypothetical protein
LSRSIVIALLLLASACSRGGGERQASASSGDTLPGRPPALPPAAADSGAGPVRQVVYVPAYSHVYSRDYGRTFDLAVILSIRNTDPERSLTIGGVQYYGTDGRLVRTYQRSPRTLAPLAAAEYVVEAVDTEGGSGASFLVEWSAATRVTDPVIQAVNIGTEAGQGISFVSEGRPLVRH